MVAEKDDGIGVDGSRGGGGGDGWGVVAGMMTQWW